MSEFTHKNPWKKYPKNLPCFCGSGNKSSECPCITLMPKMITKEAYKNALNEILEIKSYIFERRQINPKFNFIDQTRANEFKKIFLLRDNPELKEHNNDAVDGKTNGKPGVGGHMRDDLSLGVKKSGLESEDLSCKDSDDDIHGTPV